MKTNWTIFISIVLVCFSVENVIADGPIKLNESILKKSASFTGGLLAGFASHELGHQVVAYAEDVEFTWRKKGLGYVWRVDADKEDKRELKNVALGGFLTEIISSEIILSYDKIPKDNLFILGYLCWGIINPILYTISHEAGWRDSQDNDLRMINSNGLKDEYIEAVIVSHALLTTWRLLSKKKIPFSVQVNKGEIVMFLEFNF